MRTFIWFLIIFLSGCAKDDFDFYGETNYSKHKSENIKTELNTSYKKDLYEAKNKSWKMHVEGLLVTDYDHFKTEMKNNVFTTLGFEF
jgi:hypothetical protein